MRKILLTLLVLILSSCAAMNKEAYEKKLKTWVGKSETHLVSQWGVPGSVYELNGNKFLTWTQSSSTTMPGTQPTYKTTMIYGTAHTTAIGGSSPYTINFHCKTTMTIRNNVVQAWRWEGNSCR